MDQEVAEARERMKARFGKTQIGGKGTQRRHHKHVAKVVVAEDKKLNSASRSSGSQRKNEGQVRQDPDRRKRNPADSTLPLTSARPADFSTWIRRQRRINFYRFRVNEILAVQGESMNQK